MKYPTRLMADEGEAGEFARCILTDSEMGAPPPTAMHAVSAGLSVQLAQLTHVPIPPAGMVQAAATGISLVKAGVMVALIGGAGLTAVLVQPSERGVTHTASNAAPTMSAGFPNRADNSANPQAAASAMPTAQVEHPSTEPPTTAGPVQPTARTLHEPPPLAADQAEVRATTPERDLVETKRSRAATTSSASVGTFSDIGAIGESPKAKPSASQLLRETALLEQGRAALRAGNFSQAWKTLEQWGAEFPVAQLNQEREALSIELLWRSGRKDLAQERIRTFVHDYPKSAHAARLRTLLQP